ncbi:MAG TPA: hypothetical protein DC049_16490 [Spirochaetia bacterium]|nr:hypothetical protein [Spirochaetia bacterium]
MSILDENYDVKSPLELFRANEAINREKRRMLFSYLEKMQYFGHLERDEPLEYIITHLLFDLERNKILISYDYDISEFCRNINDSLTRKEIVTRAVTAMIAAGKIDITTDLKALFTGDRRVLLDIKTLADNTYGEDQAGRNIPLPKSLSYLHRPEFS